MSYFPSVTILDASNSPTSVSTPLEVRLSDGTSFIADRVGQDGKHLLSACVCQSAEESPGNSSTTNLGAGATFTGAGDISNGTTAIRILFRASHACTLFLDQSPDGANWDLTDQFSVLAGVADSKVFGTRGLHFRVRVTNNGAGATTYFRLLTTRIPIMPILPRSLTPAGNLRVAVQEISSPAPQSVGNNEAINNRAYQTAYEINLNNSGTEYGVVLFRNPSGSNKKVYIRNITFTNTTTGKNGILRVYSNPTVTSNGSPILPTSMNIGGGAPATSTMVTGSPTFSSPGTKLSAVASTQEQAIIDYDWGLVLNSGNALLVTGTPGAQNILLVLNMVWTEVDP